MLVTTNRMLENSVKDNYLKALKDPDFVSLVSKLNLSENEIMKYTTKLQNTVEELNNCKNVLIIPKTIIIMFFFLILFVGIRKSK